MTICIEPGQQKITEQQRPAGEQPDALKQALHFADIDLFFFLIEIENSGIELFAANFCNLNFVHGSRCCLSRTYEPTPWPDSSRKRSEYAPYPHPVAQ